MIDKYITKKINVRVIKQNSFILPGRWTKHFYSSLSISIQLSLLHTIRQYLTSEMWVQLCIFRDFGTHALDTEWKTQFNLCSRQRPPWTSPPQVFTSVHLLKKFVGSRFTISSPRFQNNWVKIHRRKKWDRSRFTKVKFLLRPRFTSLPKKLASYLAKISA